MKNSEATLIVKMQNAECKMQNYRNCVAIISFANIAYSVLTEYIAQVGVYRNFAKIISRESLMSLIIGVAPKF